MKTYWLEIVSVSGVEKFTGLTAAELEKHINHYKQPSDTVKCFNYGTEK